MLEQMSFPNENVNAKKSLFINLNHFLLTDVQCTKNQNQTF